MSTDAQRIRAALEACIAAIERADTSEGACCCGSDMEAHSPYDGHAPTDVGDYYAGLALDAAREALALLA